MTGQRPAVTAPEPVQTGTEASDTGLPETEGRLVENIVHFIRALRRAGVAAGPAQAATAIRAVRTAGFTRRSDFYYTLRATLIHRPEDLETFHQLFQMFWRDPAFLERMMRMMLPLLQTMEPAQKPEQAAARRATEALTEDNGGNDTAPERDDLELDAKFTWSRNEILRAMDFEQMSSAELATARKALSTLSLPFQPARSRRFRPAGHGRRPDTHAIMRRALRKGGELDRLMMKTPRTRPRNLVVLCDISGSMSVYARMMMHFLHGLALTPNTGWGRLYAFTFGTRLTNISRALHLRDVDLALQAVGKEAPDWQGGTRIGASLRQFNKDWSRRVLGQGAVVLLITDGLERSDPDLLGREADRLSLSCHRLIWLNPLLRWDGFEPKAAGIRALLPHVSSLHACHSINSISELCAAFDANFSGAPLTAI